MAHRVEAIIFGKVQGVWFRDFAKKRADGLGLVGEVENLPDGTVRAIAEGPQDKVEKFVSELQKGSPLSQVKNVSVEWHEATEAFNTFEIK